MNKVAIAVCICVAPFVATSPAAAQDAAWRPEAVQLGVAAALRFPQAFANTACYDSNPVGPSIGALWRVRDAIFATASGTLFIPRPPECFVIPIGVDATSPAASSDPNAWKVASVEMAAGVSLPLIAETLEARASFGFVGYTPRFTAGLAASAGFALHVPDSPLMATVSYGRQAFRTEKFNSVNGLLVPPATHYPIVWRLGLEYRLRVAREFR